MGLVALYFMGLEDTPLMGLEDPADGPAGAAVVAISGAWMAWSVLRRPSAETVSVQAQPSVQ